MSPDISAVRVHTASIAGIPADVKQFDIQRQLVLFQFAKHRQPLSAHKLAAVTPPPIDQFTQRLLEIDKDGFKDLPVFSAGPDTASSAL